MMSGMSPLCLLAGCGGKDAQGGKEAETPKQEEAAKPAQQEQQEPAQEEQTSGTSTKLLFHSPYHDTAGIIFQDKRIQHQYRHHSNNNSGSPQRTHVNGT